MKKFITYIVLFVFSFLGLHHPIVAFSVIQETNDKNIVPKKIQDNNCCHDNKDCKKICCYIHKQTNNNQIIFPPIKITKKVIINYFSYERISIKDFIVKNIRKTLAPPCEDINKFSSKNIIGITKKLF